METSRSGQSSRLPRITIPTECSIRGCETQHRAETHRPPQLHPSYNPTPNWLQSSNPENYAWSSSSSSRRDSNSSQARQGYFREPEADQSRPTTAHSAPDVTASGGSNFSSYVRPSATGPPAFGDSLHDSRSSGNSSHVRFPSAADRCAAVTLSSLHSASSPGQARAQSVDNGEIQSVLGRSDGPDTLLLIEAVEAVSRNYLSSIRDAHLFSNFNLSCSSAERQRSDINRLCPDSCCRRLPTPRPSRELSASCNHLAINEACRLDEALLSNVLPPLVSGAVERSETTSFIETAPVATTAPAAEAPPAADDTIVRENTLDDDGTEYDYEMDVEGSGALDGSFGEDNDLIDTPEPQRAGPSNSNTNSKRNFICALAGKACDTNVNVPRKAFSDYFGRNKACTKSIPYIAWRLYCRAHYQRLRYRLKKQGHYHTHKAREIGLQIDQMEEYMGPTLNNGHEIQWTIQFVKELNKMVVDANARTGKGEPTIPSRDTDLRKKELKVALKLENDLGANKSTADIKSFLTKMHRLCIEQDFNDLIRVEFLPVEWGGKKYPLKP